MRSRHVLGRRTVLTLAALTPVALVVSCGDSAAEQAQASDDPVRADAIADEQRLIDSYRSAIAAHPDLADQLGPILTQHQAHSLDLGGPQAPTAPSAAESQSASPGSASAGGVPTASETITALREAERAAAAARIAGCGRAGTTELARLLSLIGASEAQHVAELTQ